MSAAWFDYDGDGNPDLYVANMWTAAGQRVIHDPHFPCANRKRKMLINGTPWATRCSAIAATAL